MLLEVSLFSDFYMSYVALFFSIVIFAYIRIVLLAISNSCICASFIGKIKILQCIRFVNNTKSKCIVKNK